MKTSIERISRNDGGSEKTRNTRRNGPKSNEEPASSSKTKRFLSSAYFSRGSPRGRLPFRLFLPTSPLPLSLSGRGSREGRIGIGSGEVVSIDRGIDSNLKKERERKERKEERLRRGNLTRARWSVCLWKWHSSSGSGGCRRHCCSRWSERDGR